MSLSTIKNNNVAVIGAGIIGVNCAAELQKLGFNVTLLDRENIGEGCSKGNAGHFATEQVFPLAEANLLWQLPKLLLDPLGPVRLSPMYLPQALPWFIKFISNMFPSKRKQNGNALKSLNKHAIDYYKPLLKAANAEYLLTTNGSLLTFEDSPLTVVEKQLKHYSDAGIPVKLLNRNQVLALEPNLSHKIQHALYFTDVAHTADPQQVCLAIARYAQSLGCQYRQFSVNHITYKHGNNASVELTSDNETLTFDQVIVATGAWSKTLLKQLDYKLPLEVERGYSLNLANNIKNSELTRPVASAERRFIMTPMSHGLRLAGTVEFAGLKKKANMQRADMLYQHAEQMLDNLPSFNANEASEDQRWLGFRPSLPDSLPVIGRAPQHNNIYFALGHQHLGLTLGAITGKLIGQVVTDNATDIDISPFSISRFN